MKPPSDGFAYVGGLSPDGRLALGFTAPGSYTASGSVHLHELRPGEPIDASAVVKLGVLVSGDSAIAMQSGGGWIVASPPFGSTAGGIQVHQPPRADAFTVLSATAYYNVGAFEIGASADARVLALGMRHAIKDGCDPHSYCTYPGAVEIFRSKQGTLARVQRLQPDGVDEGAKLGRAVAMSASGEVMAVGSERGVFLFVSEGETFRLAQHLEKPADSHQEDPDYSEGFGQRIALSADGATLAVGDWVFDRGKQHGRVLVFVRRGQTWERRSVLFGDGEDRIGAVVALSADGTTVVTDARRRVLVYRANPKGHELGSAIAVSPPMPEYIRRISVDAAGRRVVAMSANGDVCVID